MEEHLHPRTWKWFRDNIGLPTELQIRAWSEIIEGHNVLVISPTGSGKTLSAVIPPVDEIIRGNVERTGTSILYITPMKALGADMMRTLEELSIGIGRIPGKKERSRGRRRNDPNLPDAHLDVGIRTGDVPQSKRRKMLLNPPDLLVVTPENLLLMACSKARETLENIRYVIVDEVHEMVSSKRGALLSLTLEYLIKRTFERTGREPQRIGLSATIKPESIAAKYLGGVGQDGRLRRVSIVRHDSRKDIEVEIRTLFDNIEKDEMIREKVLLDIGKGIEGKDGSIVVFHNTRKQAEEMAYALIGRGIEGVLPHHGSLGPEMRKEAEEGLKDGRLKAIISSTSLELGIDIGRVGLVYQVSSPKDPGKLLQRLGRSGHGLGRISRGTIYPTSSMDLLECLAVTKAASKGELENLKVQEAPVDVLAQFIIGLTLVEEGQNKNVVWDLVRRAYPYRNLRKNLMDQLIKVMVERLPGPTQPPPRLWEDEKGGLHPRRNTRQAFYLNCGTIPKETTFKVIEKNKRKVIGTLSRDFGEALYERDVILLGSRSYRIIGFKGPAIMVREDPESQPTVPRWSGEVNPRPTHISDHIYSLLRNGAKPMRKGSDQEVKVELDSNGQAAFRSLRSHLESRNIMPKKGVIPVEVVKKGRERMHYIFHLPLGRHVTEPLGRVLAYGLRRNLGAMVDHIVTDDGFAISTPAGLTKLQIQEALCVDDFEELSCELILSSSMFRTRFSHILAKSLLVLTRFRGRDTSSIYRRNRVNSIMDMLMNEYYSIGGWEKAEGPMAGLVLLGKEAIQEVLNEKMDLNRSMELLSSLEKEEIRLELVPSGKDISIPGNSIISTWKRAKTRRKTEVIPSETRMEKDSFDISSVQGVLDPLKEMMVNIVEKQEMEGIQNQRNFLRVPMAVSNTKAVGSRVLEMTREEVIKIRVNNTIRGERPITALKAVPFFNHPFDIMSRSSRTDVTILRSFVKGGTIKPFRIMGQDRLIEGSWEEIYLSLTPEIPDISPNLMTRLMVRGPITRSEIGALCGMKGDDLTNLMEQFFTSGYLRSFSEEARFHLGARRGIHSSEKDLQILKTPEMQLNSLKEFLRRMGPFALEELSLMFSWPKGSLPKGLVLGVKTGELMVGSGPIPPMISSEEGSDEDPLPIWVWNSDTDPSRYYLKFKSNETSPSGFDGPFRNGDPAKVLTGIDQRWIDKEKVRSTITSHFTITDSDGERATWTVLERMDRISIRSLEIEEYSRLEDLSIRIARSISVYRRMGYSVLRIEKIMGVPSGEAAPKAQEPFLSIGFLPIKTTKGSMLQISPPVNGDIDTREMFENMLIHQHLHPGHHLDHPLQAVELLGGISDRWEIISRTGSKRNKRLGEADTSRVKALLEENWESMVTSIEGNHPPSIKDWDSLLLEGYEDISDIKDLSKRFGLDIGLMDQPALTWSFRSEFERFRQIHPVKEMTIPDHLSGLLDLSRKRSIEDWNNSLKASGNLHGGQDLVDHGFATEDPWGSIIPIGDPLNNGRKGGGKRIKGLLQRALVLKCALSLGAFRIEDLLEYSPGIGDIPSVRRILAELTIEHLVMSMDSEGEIIYHLRDKDEGYDSLRDSMKEDEFIIISPKDRMWRVASSYLRGMMTKGRGYIVLKGTRPVAHLIMRKMTKGPRREDEFDQSNSIGKKEYWLIKKAWLDPRMQRDVLMRGIRKRFFELGVEVMSEDEKLKIEDLYREMDIREENLLA